MATTAPDDRFEIRPVLDHGFVRLEDMLGSDAAVIRSARVSYGPTSTPRRSSRALLRYLMRHQHMTPFEMCQQVYHIKCPIFVARQLMRHRTVSINEISGRYSEMTDECYLPPHDGVRLQSTSNRQGSSGTTLPPSPEFDVVQDMATDQQHLDDAYRTYLGLGVARELARINLPLALYTEFYWSINLRNLLHFLGLRLDAHAQQEIRAYAEALQQIVAQCFPLCYEAWVDFERDAVTFSRDEIALLRSLLANRPHAALPAGGEGQETRERFQSVLGVTLPPAEPPDKHHIAITTT